MAKFDTIKDMTPTVTFAGWRFDRPPGMKITPDCETLLATATAIQQYAKNKGMEAQNVDFYIVEETVSFKPVSKTKFTIVTTTEPVK